MIHERHLLIQTSKAKVSNNMDLKTLSMKLLMLVALVSAQRGQNLHMLDIIFMRQDESLFEFLLPEHIKQSRPGCTPPFLTFFSSATFTFPKQLEKGITWYDQSKTVALVRLLQQVFNNQRTLLIIPVF